ncbi:MAG TPA: protein kinase, partial [Phytomonospora sp.]
MNAPARPGRWRIGDVIDDRYEITGVHQDGGMGLVYRVRHRSWAAELAVKAPRPEVFAADRGGFVAEAEAWVSLGLHPNVCGCHYVRLLDGVPLVFAEYVPGGSLRKWIEDGRLYRGGPAAAAARVLDLAIQTARGLDHAHGRGLVHQDVKPANVLIDDDGTAKVTDFGLAKARAVGGVRRPDAPADASVLVSAGGLTPAYASPEQAMGLPLSRRTDVYSFAVSVLEMYTGGITWMSGSAAGHVLGDLRADGPGRPGPPPLPAGLGALLERCLRHDPAERPASMAEIADAIAAVYRDMTGTDHPRPVPVAAELRADELNNRGLSLMDLGRADDAEAAFAEALAADPRHLQAGYNSGLLRWRRGAITDLDLITDLNGLLPEDDTAWEVRHLLAQAHMERGDLDSAETLLAEAMRERPGEPDLTAAARTLRSGRLAEARAVETRQIPWYTWDDTPREFDGRPIRRAAPGIDIPLSADGRWALSSCDKVVRRWDLRTGEGEAPMAEIKGDVDLDASGRFALSGDDGELRLWDLAERRLLGGAAVPEDWSEKWLMKVRLSADARTAIASVGRGRVVVWDTATETVRHLFDGHFTQAPLELSDDGSLVLSPNNDDRKIRLFATATGRCLLEIPKKPSGVMAMRIRADNRVAAIATYDHVIDLWDLDGERVVRTLTGPGDGYTSRIALSEDGRVAVTGGIDHFGAAADGPDRNSVRVWDLRTGRVLRTFASAHFGAIRGVRLTGGRAVSVGKDGVTRWSLPGRHAAAWQVSRPRHHGQFDESAREVAELVERAEETLSTGDRRAALALLTRAR